MIGFHPHTLSAHTTQPTARHTSTKNKMARPKPSTTGTQTTTTAGAASPPADRPRLLHYLPLAAILVLPTLGLAMAVLMCLEACNNGLRRATESTLLAQLPALRKLATAVLAIFDRALGGGKQLPLSLTAVTLCAMLIAVLVLAVGVFELVLMKGEEMTRMRGLRQEEQIKSRQG